MKLMMLSLWDLVKLLLLKNIFYFLNGQQDKEDDTDSRREAAADPNRNWYYLQVPELVPVVIDTELIATQLPVVQYQDLITRRKSGQRRLVATSCVVCMNVMEGREQVRELCNCDHVFHRDCLDSWIGQQQLTCPLCRAELVNPAASTSKQGKDEESGSDDPWRAERMMYLFGEDACFNN